MEADILRELHSELSRGSPARLQFTRKAFEMLPALHNPRILDVGCGRGGPTLELARLICRVHTSPPMAHCRGSHRNKLNGKREGACSLVSSRLDTPGAIRTTEPHAECH
jgi:hypothetical protein